MQTDKSIINAESAKKSARLFYFGNILAVLIPLPFFILWFGASMLMYAMLRYHPNTRVGYYTQLGAYHYYGLAGALVPILTFAPKGFFASYGLWLWGIGVLIILPLAIHQLIRIQREVWHDTNLVK